MELVLRRIGRTAALALGSFAALWIALTLLIAILSAIYAAFGGSVPDI
jgi:hypothetical protein